MYCWGYGAYGQIGNGSSASSNEFPTKTFMTAPTQMALNIYSTCAVNSSGMYCWGYNQYGEIGNGSATSTNEFPTKNRMTAATQIVMGLYSTCATNTSGMYCWGWNYYGQFGNGSSDAGTNNPFVTKNYMTAPTALAAGNGGICATNSSGMYCSQRSRSIRYSTAHE